MRHLRLLALPLMVALVLGVSETATAIEPDNPCRGVTSNASQLDPPNDAAFRRLVAQTATPITDGDGYTITARDAWFFGMNGPQLADWRARRAPLTMSPAEFNRFTHELYAAAEADGLDGRLDIRLKGSSARFWSNPTKSMPRNAAQAAEIYEAENNQWPSKAWCRAVATRFAQWLGPDRVGDKDAVPRYRPLNALPVLGISDEKSDIDIQISSDQAAQKASAVCAADGVSPCKAEPYGFFHKASSRKALPAITAMMKRWADAYGIDFTFAVFDNSGPNNYLSAFRPTDWIVAPPCGHTSLVNTAPKTPLDWQAPGLQACPLADAKQRSTGAGDAPSLPAGT